MRIALVGLNTESSTFAKHTTRLSDFEIQRGQELVDHYNFEARLPRVPAGVEWLPTLRAVAPPGGPTETAVYDAFISEILSSLRAFAADGPIDGLYLDVHGAMTVVDRENVEDELTLALREIVGPECVISASMDPHGNVSRQFGELVDYATSHRYSPHIDHLATRDRTVSMLFEILARGEKPHKAWVRIPMLLAGERTSTVSPAGKRQFLDLVDQCNAEYDVLDVGMWVGRAWADEARCSATAMAFSYDAEACVSAAARLGSTYWNDRADFQIIAKNWGSWEDGLTFAAAAPRGPVFLSDSGDNVTAGASGDATLAFFETATHDGFLASGKSILFAGLRDETAVATLASLEVGAWADIALGAFYERDLAAPIAGPWKLLRHLHNEAGTVVGALVQWYENSNFYVLVQSGISSFTHPQDPAIAPGMLQDVAFMEVDEFDVVVVKNGYLFPSQTERAADSYIAITQGSTDLDFSRLPYRKRLRPMYPLDDNFEPDLEPQLL